MSNQPPEHEPEPHEDYSVEKSRTPARQGATTGKNRWILHISLTLVILGMIVAWLIV
ncbi:MAG TPA: hypothetical protein VKY54_01315 [Kiloniellales bacterium]|jgi:hypothetical protein|nr:hypothetical protein [Kiloniellales bacterium]